MIAGSWGEVAQIHKYFLRFDRCRSGNRQSFQRKEWEHLEEPRALEEPGELKESEELKGKL